MKLILKLVVVVIMLSGCSTNPKETEQANVHLYAYEGVSVKVIVLKENYNKVVRLEMTQNETADVSDQEMAKQLEMNRKSIEDFVINIGNSQLVLGDSDPENWQMSHFLNVRLSEEVKPTDNDLNVYLVKYVLDFTHENAREQSDGYDEVIDYFGLKNIVDDGKLLFDEFKDNEQFIYHKVLIAENGLYVPQLED